VHHLYNNVTTLDDVVQGYLSVLKVNYENYNVLSSAKRSVKSETSYEAVISGWLTGLEHLSGFIKCTSRPLVD
jgi:hypothetical protein